VNSAVIVAGGNGSRMSENIPKQFIKIMGEEILSYSVNIFLKHPKINEVIIVSHQDWIETVTRNYPSCIVVKGGKRRQDSSLNGVMATHSNTENVLIHDAARPFISSDIVSACLNTLNYCEGTAPVLTASNSLVKMDKGIPSYVDRSQICEVQTPQCFKKKLIIDVLSLDIGGTDEIGMVLKAYPKTILKLIPGNEKNKKITTDLDLYYFKLLLN